MTSSSSIAASFREVRDDISALKSAYNLMGAAHKRLKRDHDKLKSDYGFLVEQANAVEIKDPPIEFHVDDTPSPPKNRKAATATVTEKKLVWGPAKLIPCTHTCEAKCTRIHKTYRYLSAKRHVKNDSCHPNCNYNCKALALKEIVDVLDTELAQWRASLASDSSHKDDNNDDDDA
jgi:hypothetical protein